MTEQLSTKIGKIYYSFDGKLVGSKRMKKIVSKTVSMLPTKIASFITSNCWFIGSMEDAWAFTFTGNDLKDHHLIFLSDELLSESDQQIQHSILHEIGHVVLAHRNSILVNQSREEIRRQEKEADEFANKYI